MDELRTRHRLTLDKLHASDGPDQFIKGLGIILLEYKRTGRRVGGPILPLQVIGAYIPADRNGVTCDKDLLETNSNGGGRRQSRRQRRTCDRRLLDGAHQKNGADGRGGGDQEYNQSYGRH
jgi:hypothetical protein